MIKEVQSNSNIKTYLARIEPIVKEIIPRNKDEYYIISENLEKLKEELNIHEIIEENGRIYLIIDNNNEICSKIDKLILSNQLSIKQEGIIQGHGNPITKDEIFNLFKMERSMCKIFFETLKGDQGKGTGFFCEMDNNFPIRYALFTNNHILNEFNIQTGSTIYFEYLPNSLNIPIKKEIKINNNRKAFTNRDFDYTCIELLKSDGILVKLILNYLNMVKIFLKIIIYLFYNFLMEMICLFHVDKYYPLKIIKLFIVLQLKLKLLVHQL